MLNPWKLPANAYLPLKAMSELAKLSEPMFAGLKNPGGRSLCARSSMPLLAEAASSQPAPRPIRGSSSARAAAGTRTASASATPSMPSSEPRRRRRRGPRKTFMSSSWVSPTDG